MSLMSQESWTETPDAPYAPRNPEWHCFDSEAGAFLFLVNGSRLFRTDPVLRDRIMSVSAPGGELLRAEMARLGLFSEQQIDDIAPPAPSVHAVSLAVAQKCNLGCTYCYAQGGSFGTQPQNMSAEVALRAIDLLFNNVKPGDTVSVAFLGGEPLFNRPVIQAATRYAALCATEREAHARFAITTNGTLFEPADAEFFEEHGFAVTVSLDGVGEQHDRQRPFKNGADSYSRILKRMRPALDRQRRMQVSARVTVTDQNSELLETLETFIALGFHSVGFSPLLYAPSGHGELRKNGLAHLLQQMEVCGKRFEEAVMAGRRYPFANMANAMREIHRGTHRPYPCGAGAGYLGVSAEGGLYACHRFVNDETGLLGNLSGGIDRTRQAAWLTERHVHRQEPCNRCWARYLCGGGCHHEVLSRGRAACDYIRGWLHYCLQAYTRLLAARPDYFFSKSDEADL
jgi:uncharacterized protein